MQREVNENQDEISLFEILFVMRYNTPAFSDR